MKQLFVLLVLLILNVKISAQDYSHIVFDKDTFQLYTQYNISPEKLEAIISLIDVPSDGKWLIYFPGTKQVAYTFGIKDKKLDGLWRSYYENGNMKRRGIFEKGSKEYIWKSWYENGKPMEEAIYKENAIYSLLSRWDLNGFIQVKEGVGSYQVKVDDVQVKFVFKDGKLMSQDVIQE